VLEKLHETQRNTQANTNVTGITEQWNGLVAFLGDKGGSEQGRIRQTGVVGTVLAG
jgi:hypothetical protein